MKAAALRAQSAALAVRISWLRLVRWCARVDIRAAHRVGIYGTESLEIFQGQVEYLTLEIDRLQALRAALVAQVRSAA